MTMRYKVGRSVEVLTKKKVPDGVWRCAEIVADNGNGYTVRFSFKAGVEKVSYEAVRPCAPSTESMVWVGCDVVEVFDSGYWKVSVIEEVLGVDCYQICVIGSLDEFRVPKSNIRMRHEWKDNTWVSLGKDSENCEDLMIRIRKKARMQQEVDLNKVQPIANDCPKSLKRSFSHISYTDEDYSESTQQRRAVNKDSYSFIGAGNSCGDFKEFQSIHDDVMLLASASKSADCDLLRHRSLIAAFLMMMSWLSTSSLVSQERDIICSCFFADKAINV